jgi:hypothetical protein
MTASVSNDGLYFHELRLSSMTLLSKRQRHFFDGITKFCPASDKLRQFGTGWRHT